MPELLYLVLILVLACPLGMGLVMWLMMRGRGHQENNEGSTECELARLRAEVAARQPSTAAFDERHPGTGTTA